VIKIIKRYWRVIIFTFVYLIFITEKETPDKYIYIVILSVFILFIDIVMDRLKKKKNEKPKP
jgi:glucose-6-phosphate-specific signal transduction histidine kinase